MSRSVAGSPADLVTDDGVGWRPQWWWWWWWSVQPDMARRGPVSRRRRPRPPRAAHPSALSRPSGNHLDGQSQANDRKKRTAESRRRDESRCRVVVLRKPRRGVRASHLPKDDRSTLSWARDDGTVPFAITGHRPSQDLHWYDAAFTGYAPATW